jgi:uncharacterized protein
MIQGPLSYFSAISPNADFFFAFLIGVGFGFVLEAAGFSSSRKLAGVFYGYDMVVLKVFFTAAITAMIGLLAFSLLGWIDLDVIYVNPLFTPSLIVGSIIMGLGFIIGGFCPGTSFCAAAIGKKDAMYFVLGLFIGVLFFAETYPVFEKLYKAGTGEPLKLSTFLGLSDGVLAIIVVMAALGTFWFAEWVEKRVNSKKNYNI